MPLKEVAGHSELLEDALLNLVRYGVLVIPDSHLRRWTATVRITANMWKYISNLFNEVLIYQGEDKHGYELYVGEGADTWSFLIWDRGEHLEVADDRWWKPIGELTQAKKRGRGLKSE